ncbi:MAG: DMT family transporter [Pseudomonadota bacterium]
MTPSRATLTAVLLFMGAGWGVTFTFSKIAVSAGYQPFGLMAWQFVIMTVILLVIGRIRRKPALWTRTHVAVYLMLGLLGSLIPNSISYMVAAHLPAGLMSILIAAVPLFAFPIAIALQVDSFDLRRAGGLLCGLACVVLIAWPELNLPEAGLAIWIMFALLSALMYAVEGNIIGKWGTWGLDPLQMLTGASIVGLPMGFALAFGTGQYINPVKPWGAPEWSLVASASIHVVVLSTYFWTVTRAGVVFASQVSYLVTAFGVISAMVILGERYSLHVWAGFALMLAGLFLVRPRVKSGVVSEDRLPEDESQAT